MIIQFQPETATERGHALPQADSELKPPEFLGLTQMDWTLAIDWHDYWASTPYQVLLFRKPDPWTGPQFGVGGAPLGPVAYQNPQTTAYNSPSVPQVTYEAV